MDGSELAHVNSPKKKKEPAHLFKKRVKKEGVELVTERDSRGRNFLSPLNLQKDRDTQGNTDAMNLCRVYVISEICKFVVVFGTWQQLLVIE